MLSFLVFTAILLTPLYPVYAEESLTNTTVTSTPKSNLKERAASDAAKPIKVGNSAIREAELKAKKQGFLAQLNRFKDQRKAKIVSNINDVLARINKNRTDQMSKHLDILTNILGRVETRTNESSATAESKATVTTSVASASAAITTAKLAVSTQAAKDYTINVASESTAKVDSKAARDLLKTDLDSTHSQVKTAANAVQAAVRAYVSIIKGVTNGQ